MKLSKGSKVIVKGSEFYKQKEKAFLSKREAVSQAQKGCGLENLPAWGLRSPWPRLEGLHPAQAS